MYKCKELCFQILRFALDDTEGALDNNVLIVLKASCT